MHILYVHQNYPAQFGHIAKYLVRNLGFRVTFLNERVSGVDDGVELRKYQLPADAQRSNLSAMGDFRRFVSKSSAVAAESQSIDAPDLVVGHSGFGSTLFLREQFDCPVVNLFEWYYTDCESESDFFAGDMPLLQRRRKKSYLKIANAGILLDLEHSDLGYCPTNWQRSKFPIAYQDKLTTVFDGVDTSVWRPKPVQANAKLRVGTYEIPGDAKIVTYVSRGFERIRGFRQFIEVAARILSSDKRVRVICVGTDESRYLSDSVPEGFESYKDFVLSRHLDLDHDRLLFVGRLPAQELAQLFSLSALHIYFTAPFVASWSLLNAMACGALVLCSDTPPTREIVRHEVNGYIAPFHDVAYLADTAIELLRDPAKYMHVRRSAVEHVSNNYSLDATIPKMLGVYFRAVNRGDAQAPPTTAAEVTTRHSESGLFTQVQLDRRKAHLFDLVNSEVDHIAQLGAWDGATTKQLAISFPNARISAYECWGDGDSRLPFRQDSWSSHIDWMRADFDARCESLEDRVTPIDLDWTSAISHLRQSPIRPNMIVLGTTYSTQLLEHTLQVLNANIPQAIIIGEGFLWPACQAIVLSFAKLRYRRIVTVGGNWLAHVQDDAL